MNTFCPFFKEKCRGNQCVMFRNGECLIVSFLQITSEGASSQEEMVVPPPIEIRRELAEVPDWVKATTAEELAAEMLEFRRKEFSEDEDLGFHTVSSFFWKSKGIEGYLMPPDIRLIMERAEILARKEIQKQEKMQRSVQLKKEEEELPSLVSHCIDWARTRGLKRLTLADVDAYILERDLDILKETRRALYTMANVELKSKR
jgi:hypothetical protein